MSNWKKAYEDCCLKADLAAVRGPDKLRSIVIGDVVLLQKTFAPSHQSADRERSFYLAHPR